MALRPALLVAHGLASFKVAAHAEMHVYAGITAAALCWTHWSVTPHKLSDVKATLRDVALENGITREDWEDKVAAVFRVASNLATHMAQDPLLLAVRDANDEADAVAAMLDLLTCKRVTTRHYFKQWSKQADCTAFDPEAAARARREAEATKRKLMMSVVTDIDASSEAARASEAKAKTVLEELTPLQRFALDVAAISDAAQLDAMFAVLNARSQELRALADATVMPAASEPVTPRGACAAARKVAVAA
jgi:hypothetical protein